eukprot:977381-Pyramimonas_sp.AAC.1
MAPRGPRAQDGLQDHQNNPTWLKIANTMPPREPQESPKRASRRSQKGSKRAQRHSKRAWLQDAMLR